MSFICALSNEPAEQPVVSPVSGNIFERRLICKYIAETGADPTNGRILSQEMLIDLKVPSTLKPKPPTATSIPGLLKALQDEWDAVMLHSFTLRQQLQAARQELSHALYQHDAACRVIARLTKEVTAAREALATLKPQAGIITSVQTPVPVVSEPAIVVEEAIPPEVISKLEEKASILTQQRKQRGKKIPDDLATTESIRSFHCTSSHVGLHSVSVPGILTMDICAHDSNKILTGGNDKVGVVFNKESEQVVAILRGHTKKITKAIYHNTEDIAITTSPDCSIRVWHIPTAQCSQLIRAHNAAVTGLSLHPTGDYILTCSADEHWSFCDIRTGKIFAKVSDQSSNQQPLTCAQFHPDGLIFGIGTADSMIKIWDLKERTNVANFPGHSGQVSAIAFSENGYYLATSADDAVVKIWDLRKLKNIKSIILDEKYEIKDLAFDQSGVYLAVAGSDVRIYQVKQWDTLRTFNDHTALATGVRFGAHASFLVSCSMDRSIKFFSV